MPAPLRRRPLLALPAFAFTAPARAADWRPERPIQLWCAFAPGGTVDITARSLARHAEQARGWPIAVTNRTGGAGVVMGNALKAAAPDGLTIGATISYALTLTPLTLRPPPFGPEEFTHIARFARADLAICVRAESPYRSIQDLAAAAKARGSLGITAQGKEVELGLRALARHFGAPLEPIPVRGGAEGYNQLLGGHVEAAVLAGLQAQSVRDGTLRELANLGPEPLPLTPGAPTLRQLGLDLAIEPHFQIIGPKGMPAPAVAALAVLVEDWFRQPDTRALLAERILLIPRFVGPEETTAATRAEAATMGRLLAEFGG